MSTPRSLLLAVFALALPAKAASLSDAFNEGTQFGRTGNANTRGAINSTTPQNLVPRFSNAPLEASYFGAAGLSSAAAARIIDCANTGPNTASSSEPCAAIEFSQRNPTRRPSFTIAPTDPLLQRANTITADPHAVAGNLAGTYSACSVQTVTQPDVFETLLCHRYPTLEAITCQKQRIVNVAWDRNCVPGTWFGNYWVNTWGNGDLNRPAGVALNAQCQMSNTVRMSLDVLCAELPCDGHAEIEVDASTGSPSPVTFNNFIGRAWYYTDVFNRVDYNGGGCTDTQCSFSFCTRYEDAGEDCRDDDCVYYSINELRACGTFVFERPRIISTVTEYWDNQCAPFEARLP